MIQCYCSGRCSGHNGNGTCTLKKGGYCYAFVQEVVDVGTNTLEPEWSYGCLPPDESGYMQCMGDLSPHQIPRSIACCNNISLCNLQLNPVYRGSYGPAPPLNPSPTDYSANSFTSFIESREALYIVLPLFLVSVMLFIFMLIYMYKTLSSKQHSPRNLSSIISYPDHESHGHKRKFLPSRLFRKPFSCEVTSVDLERSTASYLDDDDRDDGCVTKSMDSSGGTVPLLVNRTIHRDIQFQSLIGRGRYGKVWKGHWKGHGEVAIKVFLTTEEASWKREQAIYKTPLVRHENLLQFIATDIRGTGCSTQMLLITDYHENGSLFDVLASRILNQGECLRLMYSAACGLCFLHTEISGKIHKPGIAHRDIKSKNILVKSDMTCCIADFGLSVTYESSKKLLDVAENTRVGTKRYMAPEVLDETLKADDFESYKRADIYSFSLVLWEIIRRYMAYEYQVPYQGLVPNDPSFEDMKQLVCIEKVRPDTASPAWSSNKFCRSITKLLIEGWSANPKVRPTARKVKKDLDSLHKSTPAEEEINDKSLLGPTDLTNPSDCKKTSYIQGSSGGSTGKNSLSLNCGVSGDSNYKVSYMRPDTALIANGFVQPAQQII